MNQLFLGNHKLSPSEYHTLPAFSQTLSLLNLSPKFTIKHFKNSTHYHSTSLSLELQFLSSKLHSIFHYISPQSPTNPPHLPYNISPHMTATSILHKLGEPYQKRGGKITQIEFSYPKLGIDIVFNCKNWEMKEAGIKEIVCYEREEGNEGKCGLCGKGSTAVGCRCGLVGYCGEKCREEFGKYHKEYCEI